MRLLKSKRTYGTAISKIAGIIILAVVIGFSMTACDWLLEDIEISLGIITADGDEYTPTTKVTIPLAGTISHLNAGDVRVSGVDGVSRGIMNTVPGKPGTWELTLVGVAQSEGGMLTIELTKTGYNFTPNSREVKIYGKSTSQPPPQIKVTVSGIDNKYNNKVGFLWVEKDDADVACAVGTITNGTDVLDLLDDDNEEPFRTTGTYDLYFFIRESASEGEWLYDSYLFNRNITATTTIQFSDFTEVVAQKGTLTIKNDTFGQIEEIIVRVLVNENNKNGEEVIDDIVSIASTQSKVYPLPYGTYYVEIRTDAGWSGDKIVTISATKNVTLTLTNDSLEVSEQQPLPPTQVTFSSLGQNGTATSTTTQLTLGFSAAITGLSADDITITHSVSGQSVTKGTLGGTAPNYTLGISGFTAGGTLTVTVAKTGYTISNSTRTATIFHYTPPATRTVTFNSNGGTTVNPVNVDHGKTISAPTPPTRTATLAGLYEGTISGALPTNPEFDGWYAPDNVLTAFDFTKPITADITLTARWKSQNYVEVLQPGNNLPAAVNRASSIQGELTLLLDEDVTIEPHIMFAPNGIIMFLGATQLTIIGIKEVTINTADTSGRMFHIDNRATLILGNNITLQGRTGSTDPIISLGSTTGSNSANLTMLEGSKITGHNTSGIYGAVSVDQSYASFIMKGGEITGNHSTNNSGSGGVYVRNGATFTMTGGKITGNTRGTSSTSMDVVIDGQVSIGKATQTGGTIGASTPAKIGTGTLTIKNDTFGVIVETIIRVIVNENIKTGVLVFDDTVSIASTQSKVYDLPFGTYYVELRTSINHIDLVKTVTISAAQNATITLTNAGVE
jgi:uncharacterized repeat protein (TIGR02543 family)